MNDDGKGANLTKSTLMLVHTYMEVTYYSDSENSGVGHNREPLVWMFWDVFQSKLILIRSSV